MLLNSTSLRVALVEAAILTLALACLPCLAQEEFGGKKRKEDLSIDTPRVEKLGNISVVSLPEALLQSIRKKYPGFRVPAPEDLRGLWPPVETGGVPRYVAWGDYNGVMSRPALKANGGPG